MTETRPVQAELRELRRGRGCEAADMHAHVGPTLRRVCGVSDTDSPAAVRSKAVDGLSSLCERLPPDLRLAARTALALDPETARRFLKERMAWLAKQFDRDPRVARRRVDQAFTWLAELVEDLDQTLPQTDFAPDGWYTAALAAVLRMDLDPPVLTETRTVVSLADDLDELVISLSAPRPSGAGEVTAEAQYGGEIVEERDTGLGHARFVLRLPEPLSLGDRHEYSVSFRAASRSAMRPYYVISPLRRCDHFTARVKFEAKLAPQRAWRVNGLPSRLVDEFQPTDEPLEPNALGEVFSEFFALRQGLSYGIQWSAASPRAAAGEGENNAGG